jgi:hypothetical protein
MSRMEIWQLDAVMASREKSSTDIYMPAKRSSRMLLSSLTMLLGLPYPIQKSRRPVGGKRVRHEHSDICCRRSSHGNRPARMIGTF